VPVDKLVWLIVDMLAHLSDDGIDLHGDKEGEATVGHKKTLKSLVQEDARVSTKANMRVADAVTQSQSNQRQKSKEKAENRLQFEGQQERQG